MEANLTARYNVWISVIIQRVRRLASIEWTIFVDTSMFGFLKKNITFVLCCLGKSK